MNEKKYGRFRFSVITPVHVGSGEKLSQVDVAIESNRCIVVNIESLLLRLQDNRQALNEFGDEGFNITQFLQKFKIAPKSVEKYSIHNKDRIPFRDRFEIQEITKTGLGSPYVPGSSIKGAIRTVLLWHLFKEEPKRNTDTLLDRILGLGVKRENADEELERYFFGHDPNHDFMRVLQVGDVEFRIPDLKLAESKVLTLTSEGSFGWKKMGKKSFASVKPGQATSIYCEVLEPGAASTGRMKVENFLLDNPLSAKELNFSGKKDLFDGLADKCSQFARAFIDQENAFYESCNMKPLVEFYTNLRERISQEGNGAFFLHLGWGSGWRATTGNYLDDAVLLEFRKLFGLGKSICPKCGGNTRSDKNRQGYSFCYTCKQSFPTKTGKMFGVFPKTRKIAFENGLPRYPLGWIRVQLAPATGDALKGAEERKPSKGVSPKSKVMEKLENFRLRPSPEHFKVFLEEIGGEETMEIDNIDFSPMKEVMNIGFVGPLEEANVPEQVKRTLARKLLEIIEKKKAWKGERLAKYERLLQIARGN